MRSAADEEDADAYVVVVWSSKSTSFNGGESQQRGRFETFRMVGSRKPLAWRLGALYAKYPNLVRLCTVVASRAELEHLLGGNISQEAPLLIPIHLASQHLGWKNMVKIDG